MPKIDIKNRDNITEAVHGLDIFTKKLVHELH